MSVDKKDIGPEAQKALDHWRKHPGSLIWTSADSFRIWRPVTTEEGYPEVIATEFVVDTVERYGYDI